MEIKKFKKLDEMRYKVYYEQDSIILYEEVILKYDLLLSRVLDIKVLDNILKDNRFYEVYYKALNFVKNRRRTIKEVFNYLVTKGYEEDSIYEVVGKLEGLNILNDYEYIDAFIHDKLMLSFDGPYKIRRCLINKGISKEKADEKIILIDKDIFITKINKIISKKLLLNNRLSVNAFKKKVMESLYILGYGYNLPREVLEGLSFDEADIYIKEESKIRIRYEKRFKDEELENEIKKYMYSNGFIISE
ncbi:MAG: RecX family transcriptional regulator [Bacilli bacterium]